MQSKNRVVSIEFLKDHLPAIKPGRYRAFAEQTVTGNEYKNGSRNSFKDPSVFGGDKEAQYFEVAGPRFSLNPSLINHTYPPKNGNGQYDGVLPSIILNRSSLPWERSLDYQKPNDNKPWLALLVFDESDFASKKVIESNSTLKTFPFSSDSKVTSDLQYDESTQISVLTITQPSDLLPDYNDIDWLAHARISNEQKGPNVVPEDSVSVVLANRLPTPGVKNTVYLVSMESYYDQISKGKAAPLKSPAQVIALYKWQFFCKSVHVGKKGTFEETLEGLNTGVLNLDKKPTDTEGLDRVNQGHIPAIHWLRNGGHTVSWFRSPLAPSNVKDLALSKEGTSSDEYLVFDPKTGMFNTTYAAAWELGRQMGIENEEFSKTIYQYKHDQNQLALTTKQAKAMGGLDHLYSYSLPEVGEVPEALFQITTDWKQLHHIPFCYLVPDPKLLPKESLRLFNIDTNWINAFLSGALSIGYFPEITPLLDFSTLFLDQTKTLSGFLLRSDIVSGWPHLQVDGYNTTQTNLSSYPATPKAILSLTDKTKISESISDLNRLKLPAAFSSTLSNVTVYPVSNTRWELVDYSKHEYYLAEVLQNELHVSQYDTLPILRMEKLGKDTLLVLFADQTATIDFHLKPGPLHSGFESTSTPGSYTKTLKDPGTGNESKATPLNITTISKTYKNVLDIPTLTSNVISELKKPPLNYTGDFTSAEFGLEMIEGAPRVRFQVT